MSRPGRGCRSGTPGIMPDMARPARRADVAALAGVAPTTVSLVLNRTPGPQIPEETRRRVEEAARKLHYHSSSLARGLATGRTGVIGVGLHFVDQPFHDYCARILDGTWVELDRAGLRLLLVRATEDRCLAGMFHERSVDGLLLVAPPAEADDPELRDAGGARFPMSFIGSRPAVAIGDYVDIDNLATAREATARLIALGHREILHLAGPLAVNSSAIDRRDGWRQALREAGLEPRPELEIDCSYNGNFAAERISDAIDRGLRFTAVFSANLGMAEAAVAALRSRGRRVPEDVSVIAIDKRTDLTTPGWRVATYAQPLAEIGRAAARMLVQRIQGDAAEPQRVLLPCVFEDGDSLAQA